MEEKIIRAKTKGYNVLKGALDGDIEYNTIIRTKHTYEDGYNYDYYIYGKDRKFHRCNSEGKLGMKYQDRFLNYNVLEKDFEFYKLLEEDLPTVSEEQMLFNNLTSIDQEYVIRIMKMLQQPIDYLKSKGDE